MNPENGIAKLRCSSFVLHISGNPHPSKGLGAPTKSQTRDWSAFVLGRLGQRRCGRYAEGLRGRDGPLPLNCHCGAGRASKSARPSIDGYSHSERAEESFVPFLALPALRGREAGTSDFGGANAGTPGSRDRDRVKVRAKYLLQQNCGNSAIFSRSTACWRRAVRCTIIPSVLDAIVYPCTCRET